MDYKEIDRSNFMLFFRDSKMLHKLTNDDRVEIFRTILSGSSDLTKELVESIFSDYSINNLIIVQTKDEE
jgi:putative ubiquitin-RnfH superfamily antitoxin RatB of RatAB toxin-antitoxin module